MNYKEVSMSKAKYVTVSKNKIRGRHVVTTFVGKPKTRPSDNVKVISGGKFRKENKPYQDKLARESGYYLVRKVNSTSSTPRKKRVNRGNNMFNIPRLRW